MLPALMTVRALLLLLRGDVLRCVAMRSKRCVAMRGDASRGDARRCVAWRCDAARGNAARVLLPLLLRMLQCEASEACVRT